MGLPRPVTGVLRPLTGLSRPLVGVVRLGERGEVVCTILTSCRKRRRSGVDLGVEGKVYLVGDEGGVLSGSVFSSAIEAGLVSSVTASGCAAGVKERIM